MVLDNGLELDNELRPALQKHEGALVTYLAFHKSLQINGKHEMMVLEVALVVSPADWIYLHIKRIQSDTYAS